MIISKLGRRGQLTLPREIRRHTGLREGDRVAFIVQGDHVIIQPLTQTLRDMRGSVPAKGPQDFAAIRRRVAAARAKRAGGDAG